MVVSLTVSQKAVLDEVARTSSYSGAKKASDGAFERISTVDEDIPELTRFWDECRSELAQSFVRLLSSEGMDGDEYRLDLNVSSAFDTNLLPSMELGLFSYFVQSVVGKWYVYSNREDASEFIDRGSALLEEVKEKAYFKKKPTRPVYN